MTSRPARTDGHEAPAAVAAEVPSGARVFEALASAARGNAARRAATAMWAGAEPYSYLTLAPAFRASSTAERQRTL